MVPLLPLRDGVRALPISSFRQSMPSFYMNAPDCICSPGRLPLGAFCAGRDGRFGQDWPTRCAFQSTPPVWGATTIEDSIRIVGEEAYRNLPEDKYEYRRVLLEDTESREQTAYFYKQTLQLVLYLCAQNADITPNSEQTFYTRRSPVLKDRYAEIRKWNVGVRIGAAVRVHRSTANSQEKSGTAHASPRPHIRRGHWHHFWTGSKTGQNTRKLVLKWVAPTFVSVSAEEVPVTLHHVLSEK